MLALVMLAPVTFAEKPIIQQVTGGGWFLAANNCSPEISKKTFGFNAEDRGDGVFTGNVEYDEHDPWGPGFGFPEFDHGFPHVHGYEIDSLLITGNTAVIIGQCRLNGFPGPYGFRVTVVDNGEPGTEDTFSIRISTGIPYSDSSMFYSASNELGFPDNGGGNIQIHVPAP